MTSEKKGSRIVKSTKKGKGKQARKAYPERKVSLQLKSEAKTSGKVTLSTGETLKYRDGCMRIPFHQAKQLLKESKDFKEVK